MTAPADKKRLIAEFAEFKDQLRRSHVDERDELRAFSEIMARPRERLEPDRRPPPIESPSEPHPAPDDDFDWSLAHHFDVSRLEERPRAPQFGAPTPPPSRAAMRGGGASSRRPWLYGVSAISVAILAGLAVSLAVWSTGSPPPQVVAAKPEPPPLAASPSEDAARMEEIARKAANFDASPPPPAAPRPLRTTAPASPAEALSKAALSPSEASPPSLEESPVATPAPSNVTASPKAAAANARGKAKRPAAENAVRERPAAASQRPRATIVETNPVPPARQAKPPRGEAPPVEAPAQASTPPSSGPLDMLKNTATSVSGAINNLGRRALGMQP